MSNAAFETGTRDAPLVDTKADISPDLDSLADFLTSLSTADRPPYRTASGGLTADGVAGRELFKALD